jgi:hypothetical protein
MGYHSYACAESVSEPSVANKKKLEFPAAYSASEALFVLQTNISQSGCSRCWNNPSGIWPPAAAVHSDLDEVKNFHVQHSHVEITSLGFTVRLGLTLRSNSSATSQQPRGRKEPADMRLGER